MQFVKLAAGEQ